MRSKRSQGSVCKLKQRHSGSLPSGLCLCIPQRKPREKALDGLEVQFSICPLQLLSRSSSASVCTAPPGQGQVCSGMPGYQFCPAHHNIFTHGHSFQGTILTQVQLGKIPCQIPQNMLNKTQDCIKSCVKSTRLHFMAPAIDCAYLQKVFNLQLLLIQKMGNDPYFIICLHFCIAIILASKQKLSRRHYPTKERPTS